MATLTRSILQNMAEARLDDSKCLYQSGRYSSAYYLAGYSVECALKACFASQIQQHDFPEKGKADKIFEHDLQKLVKHVGLPLQVDCDSNPLLRYNWVVVKDWNEQSRYDPLWLSDPLAAQEKAESIILAIDDPANGVFQWLRKYW